MRAPAKELFQQRFPSTLKERIDPWSELSYAAQVGACSYVDIALAEKLLGARAEDNRATAAFLCHLSRSSREGDLCVVVDGEEIQPSPKERWLRDCQEGEREALVPLVESMICGFHSLPREILTEVAGGGEGSVSTPLCQYGDKIAFQKNWVLERQMVDHLNRLTSPLPQSDGAKSQQLLERLRTSEAVNAQQAEAIAKAMRSRLTLICGGPGTGKTYTAGHLVNALAEQRGKPFSVALAAPTGKAASQLQRSLQRSCVDLLGEIRWQSSTLHALLQLGQRGRERSPLLPFDLVLVDEASMIDLKMMSALLAAVKPEGKLLLLGDPDQLPPVEAGMAFAHLVSYLQDDYLCALSACVRIESSTLLAFASAVREGDAARSISFIEGGEVPFAPLSHSARESLLAQALPHFIHSTRDLEQIAGKMQQFRILTPFREGPYGVSAVNRELYSRVMSAQPEAVALPIMIQKNNRKMALFNGECGILVQERPSQHFDTHCGYAYFPAGEGLPMRRIPAALLPEYELAFCMSVHKSQGSEYERVTLLLPEGSELFGRELLYTAITRAKREFSLYSDMSTLHKTVQRRCHRLSILLER